MAVRRVVYIGYNFLSSCLRELLLRDDCEVVLCLTGRAHENISNILKLCEAHAVPVHFGKPNGVTVRNIRGLAPDLVVCAAYAFRVPVEELTGIPCINVHPSLLPVGRGYDPLPYLLSSEGRYCGISIHEMTPEFDAGPLLDQEPITVTEATSMEQLALMLFEEGPKLLARVLDDFDAKWQNRCAQGKGSYFPAHTPEEREIDARTSTVEEAADIIRRFGYLGLCVRTEEGRLTGCAGHVIATGARRAAPGSILMDSHSVKYISLVDGLLMLRSFV